MWLLIQPQVSWIKVVGMLPTLPTPRHPTYLHTPPRTLPSWIIKANPSCIIELLSLFQMANSIMLIVIKNIVFMNKRLVLASFIIIFIKVCQFNFEFDASKLAFENFLFHLCISYWTIAHLIFKCSCYLSHL